MATLPIITSCHCCTCQLSGSKQYNRTLQLQMAITHLNDIACTAPESGSEAIQRRIDALNAELITLQACGINHQVTGAVTGYTPVSKWSDDMVVQ